MRAAALAALLLLLTAGCGSSTDAVVDPPAQDGPGVLEPLPPWHDQRPDDITGYRRTLERGLWRLTGIEDDDRTIVITAVEGGCLSFHHLTLDASSDTAIELTAWREAWEPTDGDHACTADLRFPQHRIRLPEPIGGRRLGGQCVPGDATVAQRQCPDDRMAAPRTPAP